MLIAHSNISSAAAENWSLQKQLHLPEWLPLKIDQRTRYEGYTNAFKRITDGSDQALAFRTNVFMGIKYNNFSLGSEFIDSRLALEGSNTSYKTSLINQTDLAQAYAAWKSDNFFNSGLNFAIKTGRQTMDVGESPLNHP